MSRGSRREKSPKGPPIPATKAEIGKRIRAERVADLALQSRILENFAGPSRPDFCVANCFAFLSLKLACHKLLVIAQNTHIMFLSKFGLGLWSLAFADTISRGHFDGGQFVP